MSKDCGCRDISKQIAKRIAMSPPVDGKLTIRFNGAGSRTLKNGQTLKSGEWAEVPADMAERLLRQKVYELQTEPEVVPEPEVTLMSKESEQPVKRPVRKRKPRAPKAE